MFKIIGQIKVLYIHDVALIMKIMGALTEDALDRHFQSQLSKMSEIYGDNIISEDNKMLSNRWLKIFSQASQTDKYARNCLMLLMCGQLLEKGRLGKPFVEVRNMSRKLDDILSEYDGKMDEDVGMGDVSNVSTCGSSISSLWPMNDLSLSLKNCSAAIPTDDVTNNQDNGDLPKKINPSVESKKLQVTKNLDNNKLLRLLHRTTKAIELLRNWTGNGEHINFLGTILKEFTDCNPEFRMKLQELDRTLERVLDSMVNQSCERRENNVRILYDELFKQQQQTQLSKQWEQLQARAQELLRYENEMQKRFAMTSTRNNDLPQLPYIRQQQQQQQLLTDKHYKICCTSHSSSSCCCRQKRFQARTLLAASMGILASNAEDLEEEQLKPLLETQV